MKIATIVLILIVLFTAMVQADAYEVLVVDIAADGDSSKIAEFKKDARQFNGLQRKGYASAKPYFNLLRMTNGKVYFVFGFRGAVQGIHRHNYPETVKKFATPQKERKPEVS